MRVKAALGLLLFVGVTYASESYDDYDPDLDGGDYGYGEEDAAGEEDVVVLTQGNFEGHTKTGYALVRVPCITSVVRRSAASARANDPRSDPISAHTRGSHPLPWCWRHWWKPWCIRSRSYASEWRVRARSHRPQDPSDRLTDPPALSLPHARWSSTRRGAATASSWRPSTPRLPPCSRSMTPAS